MAILYINIIHIYTIMRFPESTVSLKTLADIYGFRERIIYLRKYHIRIYNIYVSTRTLYII